MRSFWRFTGCALLALLASQATPAQAHWCSNIWSAPARIVVKPDKSTVFLSTTPTKLRVYVQNNYPYLLRSMELRGQAPGYTIQVAPPQQQVHPGQQVGFLLTITKDAGSATVPVSTLDLQLQFRPGKFPNGWLGQANKRLNPKPSQSSLMAASSYSIQRQDASLSASTLSALYPNAKLPAGSPFFGRTGIQQVIHWFGHRFCYSSSGSWRCGGQNCPSPCAEGNAWSATDRFPNNSMRAGAELVAWHARAKLGSNLTAARAAAISSLKGGGSQQHKCIAAVVGGYLWQGAASTSSFTSALNSGGVPGTCGKAGLRVLNGSNPSSCGPGTYHERAACAAAEGIRGNDGPVKSVLVPNAGDGGVGWGGNGYQPLFYAYMLYMVTAHRAAKTGKVTYYPDAGKPTGPTPDLKPPQPDSMPPQPDAPPPPRDLRPPRDVYQPGQEGTAPTADSAAAGGDAALESEIGDRGCTCTLTGARQLPLVPLLALFTGLVVWRRRRR